MTTPSDADALSKNAKKRAVNQIAAALKALGAHVDKNHLRDAVADVGCGADDDSDGSGARSMFGLCDESQEPKRRLPNLQRCPASQLDFPRDAEAFLDGHSKDGVPLLRYDLDHQQFLVWNGNCYEAVSDKWVEVQAQRFLDKQYDKLQVKHKVGLVNFLQGAAALSSNITSPCWLGPNPPPFPLTFTIAVGNGVLNIDGYLAGDDKFLISPTPCYFTRTATSIAFNPEPPRPARFLQFLDESFGGDADCIELAQMIAGYLLLNDNSEQKIFLFVGAPRSGKGVFCDLLRHLVGWRSSVDASTSDLVGTFGLAPLLGKRLCVVPDARFGRIDDQTAILQRLLMISGDDPVSVNVKFKPPVRVRLGTRFVIVTNEAPAIYDASGAIASRFVVLPFQQSFLGREDVRLKDTLREELEGILLWAVHGVGMLRDRKGFIQPAAAEEWREQVQALASPVRCFVEQRCRLEPAAWTSVYDLFEAYKVWADVYRLRKISVIQFGREFLAAFQGRVSKTRPRVNGRRVNGYQGIVLRQGGDDE